MESHIKAIGPAILLDQTMTAIEAGTMTPDQVPPEIRNLVEVAQLLKATASVSPNARPHPEFVAALEQQLRDEMRAGLPADDNVIGFPEDPYGDSV